MNSTDSGDWISLVAALIALAAMVVTIWQTREAKESRHATQAQAVAARDAADIAEASVKFAQRSAQAAEDSATEARKANEFIRQKDEHERVERETDAVIQASKIVVERTGSGGLAINILNNGDQSVFDLVLLEVVPVEDPAWHWRPNPRVWGSKEVARVLYPGGTHTWHVVFESEAGEERYFVGQQYDVRYEFTDSSGQRWRRTNDEAPVSVAQYNPENKQDGTGKAPLPLTEADLKLELLRLLAAHIEQGESVNILALPERLNQDDATVQRCLRQLYDEGHIVALPGDDRIVSIRAVTAEGHNVLRGAGR